MGGQRLCWHCDKQLWFPHFEEVVNQNGVKVRVHKECKADALRSIRPYTALQSDIAGVQE